MTLEILRQVKFDKNGLVPAVLQDYKTDEILMLAYMDKEALKRTLRDKQCWYWSRSRHKYWLKGETSGNIQKVKQVCLDCDGDALVIKIEQVGGAACHTGFKSCFYRVLDKGRLIVKGKRVFDPEKVYKK
ncbi:MAG: phosphoribosyl-AMP cyclohydrolase [bacterium]|nr:phosphoribosyl-AMP cyclohydrolase [bacterium]MDD5354562.1 phosphoribosyl-AMP cyclohydrolase [bacterium]